MERVYTLKCYGNSPGIKKTVGTFIKFYYNPIGIPDVKYFLWVFHKSCFFKLWQMGIFHILPRRLARCIV
ncbi:MAG: hypothetical protein FADNKDHG_01112 [Holosporales bacterium]